MKKVIRILYFFVFVLVIIFNAFKVNATEIEIDNDIEDAGVPILNIGIDHNYHNYMNECNNC